MNWFKITITKEQVDNGVLDDLSVALESKFKKAKRPKDFITFFASNSPAELHWIILSPACDKYAKDILKQYSAEPYTKPDITSVTHFVGDFDGNIFDSL